ncbi:MAG: antitoxin family protein [Bacteroidetes bacterium]|nr:antitoxin family protein [Bacteroidota bacterium]
MNVKAVYERGVFRPKEKVNIPEHKELVIHFWPEINHDSDIENAYVDASSSRPDLEDWAAIDAEGWI